MAQGQYKVGEIIEVTYQAAASTTGLADVMMEIYDETGAKDVPNFPDVVMVEIGVTGRYKGSYTPDAEGKWRTMMDSATKSGKVVKDFDVVAHNVDSVGDAVATADGKIDTTIAGVSTVDGKVDAVDAKVDASETAIRGTDGDTLKTLSDQIDNVAGTDSAPMIG